MANNCKRHIKLHSKVPFKCTTCTKFFNSTADLEGHVKAKHTRHWMCSSCGKDFKRRSSLNEHTKIKHSDKDKRFPCNMCEKKFTRLGHIQDNMNCHQPRASYKCRCTWSFVNKCSFMRHERECNGQAKNKCSICKRSSSLIDIIQTIHGGKRHICECGNSYKWRSGLQGHRKSCTASTIRFPTASDD